MTDHSQAMLFDAIWCYALRVCSWRSFQNAAAVGAFKDVLLPAAAICMLKSWHIMTCLITYWFNMFKMMISRHENSHLGNHQLGHQIGHQLPTFFSFALTVADGTRLRVSTVSSREFPAMAMQSVPFVVVPQPSLAPRSQAETLGCGWGWENGIKWGGINAKNDDQTRN